MGQEGMEYFFLDSVRENLNLHKHSRSDNYYS